MGIDWTALPKYAPQSYIGVLRAQAASNVDRRIKHHRQVRKQRVRVAKGLMRFLATAQGMYLATGLLLLLTTCYLRFHYGSSDHPHAALLHNLWNLWDDWGND
eukprot:TRINITY_DN11940_c0_g1_i1.p2 TRINITY_DN11940_c0_g1~~TRINITY_DN11940_c0_g1_i1.p2  ORF type:complete len:103 (-),score=10.53 TRINITY_DN11940_c0_g1_i1:35-343(-)